MNDVIQKIFKLFCGTFLKISKSVHKVTQKEVEKFNADSSHNADETYDCIIVN